MTAVVDWLASDTGLVAFLALLLVGLAAFCGAEVLLGDRRAIRQAEDRDAINRILDHLDLPLMPETPRIRWRDRIRRAGRSHTWPADPSQPAQDGPTEATRHTDAPETGTEAHRGLVETGERVRIPLPPPVPPTAAIPRVEPGQPEHVEPSPTVPALDRRGAGRWETGPGGSLAYRPPTTPPKEKR